MQRENANIYGITCWKRGICFMPMASLSQ